jgi:hypothetical protein
LITQKKINYYKTQRRKENNPIQVKHIIMSLESQLEREIKLIEDDDTLTNEEKRKAIKELYAEARQIMKEIRDEDRDDRPW